MRARNHTNPLVRPERLPTAYRLQASRSRAGISQRDLATQLQVDASTVAHYELGTRAIPPARLAECARILNDPGLAPSTLAAYTREHRKPRTQSSAIEYADELYQWWLSRAEGVARTHSLTRRDTEAAFECLLGYVKLSRRLILDGEGVDSLELVRLLAEESLPLLEASLRRRGARKTIAAA